jgi:RHS repeat-associated protein
MLAFLTPRALLEPATAYTLSVRNLLGLRGESVKGSRARFTTSSGTPASAAGRASSRDPEEGAPVEPIWAPGTSRDARSWRTGYRDSPWQALPPLRAGKGVTALAGQVLTLQGRPLAHVTLESDGDAGPVSTRTDRTGRFLLEGLSPGNRVLIIKGDTANTANAAFGLFEARVEIASNTTTALPYIIWMPRIDVDNKVHIPFPTTSDMVVTTPGIPGLELHIRAGTRIVDRDHKPISAISITPIPVDRPPFPLPEGVAVPTYFTIQPGGAYVYGGGAQLVYPNSKDEPPGTYAAFWHYDPKDRGWYVYGRGSVTPDGAQIKPEASVRLYRFTGAMANPSGNIPPPDAPRPGGCEGEDGDPVDCATGLFIDRTTDLDLPDVLPLRLARTYRSNDTAYRSFGKGFALSYALRLWFWDYQTADLVLPDGGRIRFERINGGTGTNTGIFEHRHSPTHFFAARLYRDPPWGDTWRLVTKTGDKYIFDASGYLLAIQDRHGNQTTLTRGGANESIKRITSPSGKWIEFAYNTNWLINEARDALGRRYQYDYDSNRRLISVTDPEGGITTYTYDTSDRMLTITDPRGHVVVTNEYDSNGRVAKQTLADGAIYEFVYNLDANGVVTQTDVTGPRGAVRRIAFNADGYVTSDTHALGTAGEQTISIERQAQTQLPLARVDALGRRTAYAYDSAGNVLSVTQLAGTSEALTTSLTYEPNFNLVTSVSDPLGHTMSFVYDATGALLEVRNPLNETATFATNVAGQLTRITDPLGNSTQIGYILGNAAEVIDPLGNATKRFLDAAGRTVTVTDPRGLRRTFGYNKLDRPLSVTDEAGMTTSFTYDGNGNVLTVTDALGQTTEFTYDSRNRILSVEDPLGRQDLYEYDLAGNVTRRVDGRGQATIFEYDALNRPTRATFADASTIVYAHDSANRVVSATDSHTGAVSFAYDPLDRVGSETTTHGMTSYEYDAAGRRTSMTAGAQPVVTYAYDAVGRLTQVARGGDVATLTHDAAGRRTSLTLPNGIVAMYAYDGASRLTGIEYRFEQTIVGDLSYSFDGSGRRTGVTGTLARTDLPEAITTSEYDAANQQLVLGADMMAFDSAGSLATVSSGNTTTTYTWNARSQLASVSGPAIEASFVYDATGRRAGKTVDGVETRFLYDGVNPIAELSPQGSVRSTTLAGVAVDQYFARWSDGEGSRSILTDALGSTIALSDPSGAFQTSYSYEPFGAASEWGSPSSNPLQFTARENDRTGLLYYRGRYYHPNYQRFISTDPIGFAGGDTNLYGYVLNDPINLVDPNGLYGIPGAAVGGVVGGIVGGLGAAIGGASPLGIAAGAAAGLAGGAAGGALGITPGLGASIGAFTGALGNAASGGNPGAIAGGALGGAYGGAIGGLPGAGLSGVAIGAYSGGLAGGAFGLIGGEIYATPPCGN